VTGSMQIDGQFRVASSELPAGGRGSAGGRGKEQLLNNVNREKALQHRVA
jgi:hypothetical protein